MPPIQQASPVEIQVAAAATGYFEVACSAALVQSIHLVWADATSSATITVESSNMPVELAAVTSTTAGHWCAEASVTVTGPAGAGAGGSMVHLGNLGSRRLRIKVVAAANTIMRLFLHGKE